MQELQIAGFEGQSIQVQANKKIKACSLAVNGQPAQVAGKKGQYLLRRNDGTEVTAFFKAGFPDPAPVLMVGSQAVRLVEPLAWYELAWCAFPLLLIALGGLLGALCGLAATSANTQIFRSQKNPALRYVFSGMVSLVAISIWLLFLVAIQSARR